MNELHFTLNELDHVKKYLNRHLKQAAEGLLLKDKEGKELDEWDLDLATSLIQIAIRRG